MSQRALPLLLGLLTLTVSLVGCIGEDETLSPNAADLAVDEVRIVDQNGTAVPFAQITARSAAGGILGVYSAAENGTFLLDTLPAGAQRLAVGAAGMRAWTGSLAELPATIRLEPLDTDDAGYEDAALVDWSDPLVLGRAYLGGQEATCERYNCGASEPTIEVASDGTIYVSGVCCVGESPPIWYSQDGGETFDLLEGDVLRDNYGIEGDFAIDDAGNMYFTDISVASAYISSWDSEQEHRHTVPAGPFRPIVDRPWVRAGAEDVVFFAYNTGATTEFYKSTDGGITWLPKQSFDGALGSLGQGPERDHLWLAVSDTLYESTDAGETWSSGEPIPLPSDEGYTFQAYQVPVADEAGNLWVVYDWSKEGEDAFHVYAARRDAQGSWHGPYQVSPENGTHHLPWPATGANGTLTVAWYGTLDDDAGPNGVGDDAEWYLYNAVTVDGASEEPSFQLTRPDPQLVHEGPMNRKLLDFLQVDIGPDGAIHIAYAQDRDGEPDEATNYVRSVPALELGLEPSVYPNGPKA